MNKEQNVIEFLDKEMGLTMYLSEEKDELFINAIEPHMVALNKKAVGIYLMEINRLYSEMPGR